MKVILRILLVTLLCISMPVHAAPAVIAIVAAAAAYGAGAVAMTAIAIGMAAASAYMAFTMKVPTPKQSQQELKQTVRMPRTPRNVAYGRVYTSGAMLFVEEQVGDTENDDGTYDEWLYMAIGLFDHPVHSANKVILNETALSDFGDRARHTFHNNDSGTDSYLLANAPSWKSDMTGQGVTWSALSLRFDRELFANGVPTLRLETDGKNNLWDPRNNSYVYSNNAAMVILDFLITYLGISKSRIITQGFGSFIDAINLCNESVTNPDGTSSLRYTINGVFNLEEKPLNVLTDMLAACGGSLVRMGGQYGLLPAAYNGPANFTLTESDIIGDVNIQVEPSTQDAINTVKGTFIDVQQNYVDTDYPPVSDENAISSDGGELSTDLSFRFVSDVYQAQRLASIVLRKSLAGGQISVKTNYKGAYARLGRVITLDIPTLSILGEYRVVEYSGNLTDGFDLVLAREDIDIYDGAVGTIFVPPPLTNLPVGQIAPPTSVQFLAESIGDVVQGVIQWRINAPQSVSTDVRFKDIDTGNVVRVGNSTRNTYQVNGLKAGNYTVEVRTVTGTGAVSAWSTTTIVVNVPPKPDSVTVNTSNWNVELIPVVTTGIPTGTLFEFKYLADPESYLTGNPTYDASDIAQAKTVATASSLNHGGLIPDRWQHYWVRGVNSYGKSDWVYHQTGTTREQDLVTTVVERLEAIEVVSGNWDEGTGEAGGYTGGSGYKLFGPNPDNPAENGRVVCNDIYARGTVHVTDGSFSGQLNVKSATSGERMVITNERIDVYDSSNSLRVRIGRIS